MNANRSQIKFDSAKLRFAIFLSDKFDDKRNPPLRFFASRDRSEIKFASPSCFFGDDRQIWI